MGKICLYHPTHAPSSLGEVFDEANISLHEKAKEGWVDTFDKFQISFQTDNPENSISGQCLEYLSGKIPGIDIGDKTNQGLHCKIWGTLGSDKPVPGGTGELISSLRTDGQYFITHRTMSLLELGQYDEHFKTRLTSWLIDQRQLDFKWPEITQEILQGIEKRQDLTVHKRADRLLQYIRSQTPKIGSAVSFTNQYVHAPAMAWSESSNPCEVVFLLRYLKNQGWVRDVVDPNFPTGGDYVLTVDGYAHLAELEKTTTVSSQAFVAMWFDESMASAWEQGIEPAIFNSGYEPKRIDREEHNNKIDDEIIAGIRRSRFVVADFTQGEGGARGGVYYEAGFAQGLNIPVIFTCRKDAIKKVHFDTRQYNHIVWEKPEELRKALVHRISATIGDGPFINKDT